MSRSLASPLAPDDLEARLRAIGAERYHDKHPFNQRMHAGTLTPDEIRTWARNRYYYQTRIPLKDGLIVAKSGDAAFRREWIQRIHDHDGAREGEGGLELWLHLAEAVGLERAEVESLGGVLPGVRRACDAYVELVETSDLLTSVAASLTEMFAGDIMRRRIDAFERHYPWVDTSGLEYFRTRTQQAPRDAAWGLDYVREHATSAADQARCLAALERKCAILWGLLDAIELACRHPQLQPHAVQRFDAAEDAWLVVLPERAVKLGGSGHTVLGLCDGSRSGAAIVHQLAVHAAGSCDAAEVEEEIYAFLGEMERLGVLRLLLPGDAEERVGASTVGAGDDERGATAREGQATDP